MMFANRKAQILKTGGINELLARYDWQFAKFINIDSVMALLTVNKAIENDLHAGVMLIVFYYFFDVFCSSRKLLCDGAMRRRDFFLPTFLLVVMVMNG